MDPVGNASIITVSLIATGAMTNSATGAVVRATVIIIIVTAVFIAIARVLFFWPIGILQKRVVDVSPYGITVTVETLVVVVVLTVT